MKAIKEKKIYQHPWNDIKQKYNYDFMFYILEAVKISDVSWQIRIETNNDIVDLKNSLIRSAH